MTPEEVAEWIRRHYKDNPTHGVGCSCLESMIRQMKLLLAPLLPSLQVQISKDQQERKVASALSHVLYYASQRRDY